ncbi:MAG: PDZ domain-containing protein [Planctomycetaceae bacterium]|nr:PDZ domain-containing protein [Planctomycetaceae bacterium]
MRQLCWTLAILAAVEASVSGASRAVSAEPATRPPEEAAPFFPVRLSADQFKGGEAVLRAFGPVTSEASRSTVRFLSLTEKKTDGNPRELALGTVIDANGLAVSKASQLEGDLVCWLGEARVAKATVVATDPDSDLALVKIEAANLKPVRWGSGVPKPGQWLASAAPTPTPTAVGVVSAALREVPSQPGALGVAVTDEDAGPKVSEILPGSGAARAGIQKGDIILEVAGKNIADGRTLASSVGAYRPGTKLPLKLRRDEQVLSLEATLGRRPGDGPSRIQFQNSLGGALSVRRDGFASALQHDTVLRPEDCGGPVVDLSGKVVGVNIARAGRTESYLLPASLVETVVKSLRAKAK